MSSPSLRDHISEFTASAHVVAAFWLNDRAFLALADGSLLSTDNAGKDNRIIAMHPDAAILVTAFDGQRIVTGGDDGRVVACNAEGAVTELATRKGRWIDAVETREDGAFAFSTGRDIFVNDGKGGEKSLNLPSTARGIAFAPKGYRLAATHYGGVTLWFPNIEGSAERLEWKGSHLDVTWSPDGRFLVSSMQESALHGWRIADKHHMRMTGYPAKTRSLAWSGDGKWLATSGADAAIVWPFEGKDGPMGKPPRECGVRPARVSRVAFHPHALVLAVGYEDGCILLIRFTDANELLVRPADKGGAVTALNWDKLGKNLIFGCADGQAGILALPA